MQATSEYIVRTAGSLVAGWVVPGLGHWLIGQRQRGVIILVSIGLLWLGGLAIGGIGVCDRQKHPAWFLGQMLVAPALAVNYYQHRLASGSSGQPGAFEPSYGHMKEQGILYTALAGLLNLLTLIDLIDRDADGRRRDDTATHPAAA